MKKIIVSCLFLFISLITYSQNYLRESFDAATFPPAGWNSTIGSGTYNWAQTTSGSNPSCSPHSGSGMAEYQSFNASVGSNAQMTVSPLDFSIYSTGINVVSFWMYRDDGYSSNPDQVSVYINTTPSIKRSTTLGTINRSKDLSPAVSANGWYQYSFTIPASYSGTVNYIIFDAVSAYGNNMFIDDISIDHLPPCSGTPATPVINPSGSVSVCPGSLQTLTASVVLAAEVSYQWQISTDGGTTWVNLTNDTDLTYTFVATSNAQYRFKEICNTSSLFSISSPVIVTLSSPIVYASLPYIQDFESWMSRCDNLDVPDSSWTSSPSTGDDSWRRDDQGVSDGGWSGSAGAYTPASSTGNHSARFHTFDAKSNTSGEMDLYLDCSTKLGIKQLNFDYINTDGTDSLYISLSTDNGNTFTTIGSYNNAGAWTTYSIPIASNSPSTIIKFNAISDFGGSDIGVDNVQVLPPCQNKPVAGSVIKKSACPRVDFKLSLVGSSSAGGLTYAWQQSTDSITWSTIPSDTLSIITANIVTKTYFRAIVTCVNSGLSDTTAGQLIQISPFYVCYCNPTSSAGSNIFGPNSSVGNFSILHAGDSILDDGNPKLLECDTASRTAQFYIDNDTVVNNITTLPALSRDSLYQFYVTVNTLQCSSYPGGSPVNIYLDLNQDGQFDNSELIFNQSLASVYSSPSITDATVTDTFRIPDTAMVGITGLRVMSGDGQSSPISPCGETNYSNQVIDYLVNIVYNPCTGAADAGTATVSDSTMCSGYMYTLTDTTHEGRKSNIKWIWQTSPDNVNWGDVAGSDMKDTVTLTYSFPAWHRLRMICNGSHDTTYSNTVRIYTAPSYACYCYSIATGGSNDSSDIGAFSIGLFTVVKGGPHILNPIAINGRTDYTGTPIDLFTDSTYNVSVYQTEKSGTTTAAKITMFIDFNCNHAYDAPSERVWTGFTTPINWYLNTTISIPDDAITETYTGMRVILNNNVDANTASDDGCGAYTSGETQDFVVKLHKSWPTVVGEINNINDVSVYPNPTTGKITIAFTANNVVKQLQVRINNVTGQQVLLHNYSNTTGKFTDQIDLSTVPKGIYFVELTADGERAVQKLIVE